PAPFAFFRDNCTSLSTEWNRYQSVRLNALYHFNALKQEIFLSFSSRKKRTQARSMTKVTL
ncbi:MAG: hypothetical protein IKS29_09415, partial [Oscillospiraceae bacterium]|nr:hypothetical protein [Oscillospiraceae bacterium]